MSRPAGGAEPDNRRQKLHGSRSRRAEPGVGRISLPGRNRISVHFISTDPTAPRLSNDDCVEQRSRNDVCWIDMKFPR